MCCADGGSSVTVWDDRFLADTGVQASNEWLEVLATLAAPSDPGRAEQLARITHGLKYISSRVASADRLLVTPEQLTALSVAPTVVDQLQSLEADPDLDLGLVDSYLDRMLSGIAAWPVGTTGRVYAGQAAAEYRDQLGDLVRSLAGQIEPIKAEFSKVAANAAQIEANIDARSATVEAALAASQAQVEARLNATDVTLEAQKARLDTAINDSLQTFAADQRGRAAEFAEHEGEREAEFDALVVRLGDEDSTFATERTTKADALIAELEQHERAARKLSSRTGSEAVSGGFLRFANNEGWSGWLWAGVTVLVLAAAAGYGIWALNGEPTSLGDWQWVAQRLFIFIPFGVLVAFSVRQTSIHRRREARARLNELYFDALEPYTALLEKADADKLRADLARRAFFAQPGDRDDSDEEDGLIKDVIDKSFDLAKTALTRK